MKRLILALAVAAGTLWVRWSAQAAELDRGTLTAWDAYLKDVDVRAHARAEGQLPFLWMDESADRATRVRGGEVVVAPVVARGTQRVFRGLVHDWIGAIFIPGATLNGVWAVTHDFDEYRRMYQPAVAWSRTLACSDAIQEFEMVWQRQVMFVSAAMQARYRSRDFILDPHRAYSITEAIEVREIERFGRKNERLLPPDTGNGFMWRIRSVSRYMERDGGVYVELEALALTRDIPPSVAWFVTDLVSRLSRNSLIASLRQTRDAVISSRRSLGPLASCPATARGSGARKAAAQ